MLKRILSTFITVFIMITVVTTSVYADFSITDFYPQTQELYTGKFDDGDIDTTHMVIADNDTTPDATPEFDVYEDTEKSELIIDAFESNSGSKTVSVWPSGYDAETSAGTNTKIDDYLVISFDISRYAASGKVLQMGYGLYGSGGARSGPYFQWKDSDLTLTDKNNDGLNIHSNLTLADDSNDNYHNFAFAINSSCVASLYVDGVLVRENIIQRDSALRGKELRSFDFYFAKSSSYTNQTIKIKNLKIYTATESGILKDIKSLEQGSLTSESADASGNYVLTQNLVLPTTGAGGGTITWNSSNESIISSDGTIYRHSGYEKSDAVILTAKIVNGEVEVSKNFTFYVKRKDFATISDMDGDYIVYDDFSNSNLKGRGSSTGVNVSVENGKYIVSTSGGEKSWAMFFQPDESAFTSGKYVLEYDIKLSSAARYRWEIRSNISKGYRFLQIDKDKDKYYMYNTQVLSTDSDAKQISSTDIMKPNEDLHFKYLIDLDNEKYSLYVDGALLVKDASRSKVASGSGYVNGLASLNNIPNSSNLYTMTFDNLKLYKLADSVTFAPVSNTKTISLNSENVSKIDATGTYAARLNITDYTTQYADDTDFIVALYNKITNELEYVEMVKTQTLKATVASTQTEERYGLYAKTTVDVPSDYENYYIKLMHWNGCYPMSTPVTVD